MPEADRPNPRGSSVSRRALLRLLGAAGAASALGACSSLSIRPSVSGPKSEPIAQLVYQDWRTDWFPALAQQMLDKFHELHPNIRVYFTPDPENVEEQMLQAMQAGTAPDVFQGCCTHFPIWAQQGYALDLRDYVKRDVTQATVDEWDKAQYRALFLPDGKQFGLPKYHGALALFYNKDLFDRYGVDYPTERWGPTEYAGAMQALARDTNRDGLTDLWGSALDVSWDRLQVHVNAWGGNFVDPIDNTTCRMSEPVALEALEWVRARMWRAHVMATPPDLQGIGPRDAFIAGKVAMSEDGSWSLKKVLSDAKFRVGVAPVPAGAAKRATLATTDGFGIFASSRRKDAAWELMKFLIGQDYGRAMAKAHLLQPARSSLIGEWVGYVRSEFPDQSADLSIDAFADGHLKGYSVTAEIFSKSMAEAKRIAYEAFDRIFTLGQGSIGQMSDVCRQIAEAQKGKP